MTGPPNAFLQRRWFLTFLVLASLIPLVCPSIPPLVDLPGHMGRYQVELHPNDPELARFYSFHWQLIGNLGCDLLIIPFAKLFGIELGTNLIVMGIVALNVTGMLWIAKEVHGEVPPTALFALPLAYGHPFIFGFVNYCLSMGLALCAFALWLRLGRLERFKMRAALFIGLAPLIWLAHIYGWAVLCVLCGSAELAAQCARAGVSVGPVIKRIWQTLSRTALQCIPLTPPFILMILWRTGNTIEAPIGWLDVAAKIVWIGTTLRDRWMTFDITSVGLMLLLILLGILRFQGLRFARALKLPALALLALFLLTPKSGYGLGYVDMRLTPYLLGLALIGIQVEAGMPHKVQRALAIMGLLFFGARTVGTTISFAQSATRAHQALAAINVIPQNARLVSFVGMPCGGVWQLNPLQHLPAMALVRRNAFANDQWAAAGAQLLTIHYPSAAGDYRGDPSELVTPSSCAANPADTLESHLKGMPHGKFDYVWLINPPVFDPRSTSGMAEIWSNGRDSVYRITPK